MSSEILRISKDLQECDLSGKRYVVTGGTSGTGLATVRFLAERGADVITCGRDVTRGEAELANLPEDVRKNITLWKMDLIDLTSVKEFADKVLAEWDKMDGLVNNAGVVSPSKTFVLIKDKKYDTQFMTNHVGHFHLTELLLPILIQNGTDARIVNVSSVAHDRTSIGGIIDGHIHFEDIHCRQRKYDAGQYHQSKLANVLHARKLAQIHGKEGIYAFSAHPGTVTSNLYRDYNFIMRTLLNVTFHFAGNLLRPISKEDGAQTSLHCLLSDEALQYNGAYFAQKCYPHRNGERGGWPLVSPNPEASDDAIAEKLWSVTTDMVAELTA